MSTNHTIKTISSSVLLAMLLLACKQSAHATTPTTPALAIAGVSGMEDGAVEGPEERGKRSKGITEEYYDCMNRTFGAIEKSACISDEEDRQDARLNDNYRKLLGLLKGDRRRRLIDAQREWVVLREKDAFFEASLFDNTQIKNVVAAHREVLCTVERANLLQVWLGMAEVD